MTQPYNFGAKTHIGGADTSAFVVLSAAIARHSLKLSLAVQPLRKALEDSDHSAMIAVVCSRLRAETRHAGEVVSAVINSCLPFGHHCRLDRPSMVIM